VNVPLQRCRVDATAAAAAVVTAGVYDNHHNHDDAD